MSDKRVRLTPVLFDCFSCFLCGCCSIEQRIKLNIKIPSRPRITTSIHCSTSLLASAVQPAHCRAVIEPPRRLKKYCLHQNCRSASDLAKNTFYSQSRRRRFFLKTGVDLSLRSRATPYFCIFILSSGADAAALVNRAAPIERFVCEYFVVEYRAYLIEYSQAV